MTFLPYVAVFAAISVAPANTQLAACPVTIPQLIAAHGPQPIERYRTRELVPVSLKEVATATDLVVEGTLTPLRTYLSDDKCVLYTDYQIAVSDVISGTVKPAKIPGMNSIIVRQWGGETVIDGVRVIAKDQHLPPFAPGQHVILMLAGPDSSGRYEVATALFGAFEVTNGLVRRMLRSDVGDDVKDQPREIFVAELRRLRGR